MLGIWLGPKPRGHASSSKPCWAKTATQSRPTSPPPTTGLWLLTFRTLAPRLRLRKHKGTEKIHSAPALSPQAAHHAKQPLTTLFGDFMSLLHRITVYPPAGQGWLDWLFYSFVSISLGLSYSERNMLTQRSVESAVRQTVEVAHGILANYHDQAVTRRNQPRASTAQRAAGPSPSCVTAAAKFSGSTTCTRASVMHAVRPNWTGQDVTSNRDPSGCGAVLSTL